MAWLAETSLDESETSLPSLRQLNRGVIRSVADAFVVALQRCALSSRLDWAPRALAAPSARANSRRLIHDRHTR